MSGATEVFELISTYQQIKISLVTCQLAAFPPSPLPPR